jgi:hypothetical protein
LGAFLEERRKPLLELRLLGEVFHGGLAIILESVKIM